MHNPSTSRCQQILLADQDKMQEELSKTQADNGKMQHEIMLLSSA